MKTYALSRAYGSSISRRVHSPADGAFDQDSRVLDRPNLRRYRSWPGIQSVCCTPVSEVVGETGTSVDNVTVEQWCGEFHETRVTDWQQTVAEFGHLWKRWCFAQRQSIVWQDNLIKGAMKHFWQPLGDFNYVLGVYSFLEGVRNRNLLPHLRRTYLAWRSPEQIKFHEGFDLGDGGDEHLDQNASSGGMAQDDDSEAMASKYPLNISQHLRVGRICDDVNGKLKSLRDWLDKTRDLREAWLRASRESGRYSSAMARCRWELTDAASEFSSHAKALTKELRDSRVRLCEALGLDPKRVPGGEAAPVPTMTAMQYEKAPGSRSPCQGGPALPRKFRLKKASLQAGRIVLKANLYVTLLPCKTAQNVLARMMAKSTKMASVASEAGDYKAEATLLRLHNKMRKVSERAGQESPKAKPSMTLLDSETWPAVLNPREDMQVEVHGHISMPVETLIDMLLAPQVQASMPGGDSSGTGNRPSAGSTIMTPEHSPSERASDDCQALTTSSSTTAIPGAGVDKT